LNCPSISALQWRKVTEEKQPHVTVLKIGETKAHADEVINEIVERMK
jgi:2'-5' RNA ligase